MAKQTNRSSAGSRRRVRTASRAFSGAIQVSPPEAGNRTILAVSRGRWDESRLRSLPGTQ